MMRLAWVPLPAPGGPSSTMGPTFREVSCAIGWQKPPDLSLPGSQEFSAEVQQPPQTYQGPSPTAFVRLYKEAAQTRLISGRKERGAWRGLPRSLAAHHRLLGMTENYHARRPRIRPLRGVNPS